MISEHQSKLLMRFAASGILSGVIYAGVYIASAKALAFPPFLASGAGYIGGLISGFVMHRHFTFRSGGILHADGLRYCFVQLAVLSIVSAEAYVAANLLLWPTWAVVASGIVTAPPLNFILLNHWVFPAKNRLGREGDITCGT